MKFLSQHYKVLSGNCTMPSPDKNAILKIFNLYKEPDAEVIGPEGVQKLCDDLEIDPLSISVLTFAWVLQAKNACEFTREEWVQGLMKLQVDSLAQLKAKIPQLPSMLKDEIQFREFYLFAYDYNKPQDQKSIELDTAKALWDLILRDRFKHLDLWLEFLETQSHSIPRDTYVLLLEFTYTINNDFSNFEEDGAWPVMIDEFVEFAKDKIKA